MKPILIFMISLGIFASACDVAVNVQFPHFKDSSILTGTEPLPEWTQRKIEGVYQVTDGSDAFGTKVVLKWTGAGLSVFSEKNAAYLVLDCGRDGADIHLEGYWRYARNVETGLVRLMIGSEDGGSDLLADTTTISEIIISGQYGNGDENPRHDLKLSYLRPFSEKVDQDKFYIIAHRGGGRTADYLPASENSLEMIKLASQLGANAIEIDVKLSKDGVPFLYHDKTINLRLVRKTTILGDIEAFTFPQIRSLLTLVNGEKIPTLREALEFVLTQSAIEVVWLDMKSEKYDIPQVAAIQKEILVEAESAGRQLEIFIGIPSQDKLNHFMTYPDHKTTPSLCELEPADLERTGSQVWSPRWTLGLQPDKVKQMHDKSIRVFTWTMDESEFIKKYIAEGDFDGMVTNYATLVAHYHYVRE